MRFVNYSRRRNKVIIQRVYPITEKDTALQCEIGMLSATLLLIDVSGGIGASLSPHRFNPRVLFAKAER